MTRPPPISPLFPPPPLSLFYLQTLDAIARHYKVGLNTPWEELSKKVRDVILFGSGEEEIKFSYDDGMRRYDIKKPRSEEHTSELQSQSNLVCRLLLEKKKKK